MHKAKYHYKRKNNIVSQLDKSTNNIKCLKKTLIRFLILRGRFKTFCVDLMIKYQEVNLQSLIDN